METQGSASSVQRKSYQGFSGYRNPQRERPVLRGLANKISFTNIQELCMTLHKANLHLQQKMVWMLWSITTKWDFFLLCLFLVVLWRQLCFHYINKTEKHRPLNCTGKQVSFIFKIGHMMGLVGWIYPHLTSEFIPLYQYLSPSLSCSILTTHWRECDKSTEKPERISICTAQVLPVFMNNQGLSSNRPETKP